LNYNINKLNDIEIINSLKMKYNNNQKFQYIYNLFDKYQLFYIMLKYNSIEKFFLHYNEIFNIKEDKEVNEKYLTFK
jgi:hypothetical protein